MKNKLIGLETELGNYAGSSELNADAIALFPENFRPVHSHKVFGNDLLAIPASLVIPGDDDEFELPFSFLSEQQSLNVFESEFREEVPGKFIQIGSLYNKTEPVVLNTDRNTVHIFHIQDVTDPDWLKYKLENEICTLNQFIESLRVQTVCCFMNPLNYSEYEMVEIRNGNELLYEAEITTYANKEAAGKEYRNLVDQCIKKGFELHYAPKWLKEELKKQ